MACFWSVHQDSCHQGQCPCVFKWGTTFQRGELGLRLGWYHKGASESKSHFGSRSCSPPIWPLLLASFPSVTHMNSLVPWCSKGPLPDAGIMPSRSSSHKSYKSSTLFFIHSLASVYNSMDWANRCHLCPLLGLKGFNNQVLPSKPCVASLFLSSMNHSYYAKSYVRIIFPITGNIKI